MTDQPSRFLDRLSRLLFVCSLVALGFAYGFVAAEYHLFPYGWFDQARTEAEALLAEHDPAKRPHHLVPAHYGFAGARTYDAAAVAPGLTLVTSYWKRFDWKPGIALIDREGNVLHAWKTDPAEIWPESPHRDWMAGQMNKSTNYVHGCYLFDNGDVLFSIEFMGLVRMNARGEVLWTLPWRTHHSVTRNDAGNFWVCAAKWVMDDKEGRERAGSLYPRLTPAFVEDYVLEVSPEGRVLRSISVLEALFTSGYERLFWQTRRVVGNDLLHTNDVEALPSSLAAKFPMFRPGDLLVSCRLIDSVMVIDPETRRVKWLANSFLWQHDPDFEADGRILVFDNNNYEADVDENLEGSSRIVSVDPTSGVVESVYEGDVGRPFFTAAGGKVQHLSNGNLLITEARRGRVFEIDSSGKTVWEWVHERYDGADVPEVLEGTRTDLTPEEVAAWK